MSTKLAEHNTARRRQRAAEFGCDRTGIEQLRDLPCARGLRLIISACHDCGYPPGIRRTLVVHVERNECPAILKLG
jgi:hypothetical protein